MVKLANSIIRRSNFTKNVLKNEKIAVLGYGPQGKSQSLNLRDQNYDVILGLRPNGKSWKRAIDDGWVINKNLFSLEDAAHQGTFISYLLSDKAQMEWWNKLEERLYENNTLYFSHGFGIVYKQHTSIIPPKNIDVVLVAPKGPGNMVRSNFLNGIGVNSSFAIHQDYTNNAVDKTLSMGFAIGSRMMFDTTFEKEVYSDLTGERCVLMGLIQGAFKAQYDVLRENGHSPVEAYNETVEEALQSLYPMIYEKGMDWMFENCSDTAQKGALEWSVTFEQLIKPEIRNCYESVKNGTETFKVINEEKNIKDLENIKNSELWKVHRQIKKLHD